MNSLKYIALPILALTCLAVGAQANMENIPAEVLRKEEATVAVGYRSFSLSGEAQRAAEYQSFSSSATLDLNYYKEFDSAHASLDVKVLSDEDYAVDAHLDKGSKVRFSLYSERFYHNLDHIPYANGYSGDGDHRSLTGNPAEASRPDGTFGGDIRTYYTDHDPGADYGQKIDINEVKLRVKLPTYPAHLNLAFWQLEKHGERQLRFVDESCTGCHMQSRSRKIDRVTNEFRGGVDGHFGYVDIVAEALYREFKDQEEIPTDAFGSHVRSGAEDRIPGYYEHAEDPDSTVKEFTLRANTSPSGGLVGSASVTFGKRENKSDLNSVSPVEAETDYLKTAADVTYTPNRHWTVTLRHRYLDLDNDNSSVLTAYGSQNPNDLAVRDSIDFSRAWYEIIGSYRPSNKLSIKTELRREDIERDQTGPPAEHHSAVIVDPPENTLPIQIDPYWELPADESITTVKVGFSSRLLEKSALKINGWAEFGRNDDPSYGTSFEKNREFFISASYSPSPAWGLNTSLKLLDEDNTDRVVLQFDSAPGNDLEDFDLDRSRRQQSLSFGGWLTPTPKLAFDINYGYLATDIRQDLLFGAEANSANPLRNFTIENDDVQYEQTVHTVSAGATWQVLENLSCRVEGYHIRSEAAYDPDFATIPLEFLAGINVVNGIASSSELRANSKIDLRQEGVKGRLNWQIDKNWSCTVEASYDDYDDMDGNVFDGSVVSYLASLSRTW